MINLDSLEERLEKRRYNPETLSDALENLKNELKYMNKELTIKIGGVSTNSSDSLPADPELKKIFQNALEESNAYLQKKNFLEAYKLAKIFIEMYEADNKS